MHFLSQFPTLFYFDTGIGNFGIYAIRFYEFKISLNKNYRQINKYIQVIV